MKKFAKISLITAGVLFVIGCLLAFISVIVGGRSIVRTIKEQDYLEEKMNTLAEKLEAVVYYATGRNHFVVLDEENRIDTSSGENGQIDMSSIRNMELELGAGTFIIEEKEEADGKIDIAASGIGRCNYYVEGDTFHVEGFHGLKWLNLPDVSENRVEIRVPQGSSFENVTVETGAGILEISDITVDKFEVQGGAGQFKLSDMMIGKLDAQCGAGQMEAYHVQTADAELSVGAGECIFEGAIEGNLDAECGMGNMEITLSGKETDHNYEIECAAGNVNVGSFSVSAMAAEKVINNNAASNFDIECGMGNITFIFEE